LSKKKYNITVLWWQAGAGQQGRWNPLAFQLAGHKVEYTEAMHISHFTDFVFTPIPGLQCNKPLITQLGGYGRSLVLPGSKCSFRVDDTFQHSSLITVLDPTMAAELRRNGFDLGSVVCIPNACPPIKSIVVEQKSNYFIVYNPSGNIPIKRMERFVEAAKVLQEYASDIRCIMTTRTLKHYNAPLEWLEIPSLYLTPRLPYDQALELFAVADIIAPFSAAEIHPQTFLEAMMLSKATIVDKTGMIFTIHMDELGDMKKAFGKPVREFHKLWKSMYKSGNEDHYLHAKDANQLVEQVIELYENRNKLRRLGEKAKMWATRYWKLKERGQMIVDCFERFVQ